MHEYKLSITEEVKLVKWKIKETSTLRKNDTIFEYINPSDGAIKISKYKSHLNGITVNKIKIKEGQILKNGDILFSYEKCSHPIECNDMCGVCGKDLRKKDEILKRSQKKITSLSHKLPIVASEPNFKVNKKVADEIGKKDLINLVKNKKLVLLVDLDHTLIHTTNEYMGHKFKDIYHYELCQKNIWYYTKFRPGCKKFLEEMSKKYELQIVTFGERKYAHTIANFMDHERKYFHDRILSRNEIFNAASKTDNLKALFPRGDLMVCIIDDREDVWNYARNLICVQPYIYFKNTGDINDPSANKTNQNNLKLKINENINKQIVIDSSSLNISSKSLEEKYDVKNELNDNVNDETNSLNEICKDQNLKFGKIDESLSQLKEEADNDPDNYLTYLEDILKKIHEEYYKIYDTRKRSHNNYIEASDDTFKLDESDLPDLKKVIPLIKSRVLSNVVITFSGVVPTGYDLKKQRCYLMATSLGAKVNEELVLPNGDDNDEEENYFENDTNRYEYNYDEESSSSGGDTKSDDSKRYTTHLVGAKYGTSKVHDALKSKRTIKVVTPEWLINCAYRWIRCNEDEYKLTREYDYKNCIFHEEYQKYSSSVVPNSNIGKKNDFTLDEKKQLIIPSKRTISDIRECFDSNLETVIESSSSNKRVTFLVDSTDIENKTKKPKSSIYRPNNETPLDNNSDESLIMGLNDDMLMTMDKEVDEELLEEIDDESDDFFKTDDAENYLENVISSTGKIINENDESSEESNDYKSNTNDNKHNNLSSSSSYDSEDNSANSIEDELALALEKNFS